LAEELAKKKYLYHAFLSHNGAQKDWTRRVAEKLRENGLSVFFDEDSIELGDDIAKAIEEGLQSSRHVLLVLSPAALKSDWVALEYSCIIYKDPSAAKRTLIPIMREHCDIPLMLRRIKYLDACNENFEQHIAALIKAIDKVDIEKPTLFSLDFSASLVVASSPNAKNPLYVRRKADLLANETVDELGLLTVWGPRRIGKTSILQSARSYAEQLGKRTAFVDFQTFIGGENRSDFYYAFAQRISKEIKNAAPDPLKFHSQRPGVALADFLEELPKNTILLLDEIDALEIVGALEEFTSILRGHYMNPAFKDHRCGVILASYQSPHRFIKSKYVSAFVLGQNVRIENFSPVEAETLLNLGNTTLSKPERADLFSFVGGQPFLLKLALQWLGEGNKLDDRIKDTVHGPYRLHLDSVQMAIDDSLQRKLRHDGLKNISVADIETLFELGVIANPVKPDWSCQLYKIAFGPVIR
jgi:hypothetical protein